jgi:hypothetical protein
VLPTVEQGSPAIKGFGWGVCVGVTVGVGVGVAEGVSVGEAVGVAEGDGVGTATVTPLFHTSFLPLFTQVYFFPPAVIVWPAFLQALPAFGAVAAWATEVTRTMESSTGNRRITFLMPKLYVIRMTKTIT